MGVPIVQEIWDTIRSVTSWMFDTIPRPLKFILFLFFLVFLGGFFSTMLFGLHYGCTTTGSLVDFDGFQEAIDYQFTLTFFGEGYKDGYLSGDITAIEHDNELILLGSPTYAEDEYDVISIGCQRDYGEDIKFYKPALLFLSIDVLNYQLWLILMFGGIVVSFGWKWYDQILH